MLRKPNEPTVYDIAFLTTTFRSTIIYKCQDRIKILDRAGRRAERGREQSTDGEIRLHVHACLVVYLHYFWRGDVFTAIFLLVCLSVCAINKKFGNSGNCRQIMDRGRVD